MSKKLPQSLSQNLPSISSVLTPTSFRNTKLKRVVLRASQKEIRQWQEDLDRINKEEMSLKKNIKELNAKYEKIVMRKRRNSGNEEKVADKKQKELERSLLYIDGLLKELRKKHRVS